MPFGRLHEEAAGDSKLLALSDAAWRMWGMGLIYCQKNLTDGFIPAHAVQSFGVRGFDVDAILSAVSALGLPQRLWASVNGAIRGLFRTTNTIATELCTAQVPGKAPLWERVDGGYQVHDYLQWNDSKDEILKARAEGKDRVRRYRERHAEEVERLRQIAERAGEPSALPTDERNALQPPLQPASQHAHHVVRGSGSKERKVGSGTFAGALPREHLHHIACDDTFSRCVPNAVHDKLANLLAPKHNGDRNAAARALLDWYPTVWASLPADFVMPDAFRFWQGRFDLAFASKDAAPARTSAVAGVDETSAYLRSLRSGSGR